MKTTEQRIKNIIGQLNGINKMLKTSKDCEQIFTQLKSIKSAISSLVDKIAESELEECILKNKLNKDIIIKLIKNIK